MSPLFVIICIIAFLIPVGLCIYFKNKNEELSTDVDILKRRNDTLEKRFKAEDENSSYENATEFLHRIARKKQFEVEEVDKSDEWTTNIFTYQGGHFLCYTGTKNDEVILRFYCVEELAYTKENFEKMRTICHLITKESKYCKATYSFNDKENTISVNLAIESIHPTEESFMYFIDTCFQTAGQVRHLFNSPSVSEEEHMDNRRMDRKLVDAELAHEAQVWKERKPHSPEPNHGTLSEYISYLFKHEETEDLLALRVQTEHNVETIRQRDKIATFDIMSSAVQGEGEQARFSTNEPVVLTLDAVENHYVFTLHPLKANDDFLTIRMTAVCTPHEFLQDYVPNASYEPQAISMLLCYVKSQLPELKDEEEIPTTSNKKQVAHGRKLMQQNCFLQAITVLTLINKQLRSNFFNLSEKDKELYFSTCYYLGFCYTDLRLYEKGLYYLEIANDCNRLDYSQEYINCLTECRDMRIFNVLDDESEAVRKQINAIDNDEDKGTEEMISRRELLVDYYAFLQRRRGYSQINFGFLDDATETFKNLLSHEGCRNYAEHELQYIETLRNGKNKQSKNNNNENS